MTAEDEGIEPPGPPGLLVYAAVLAVASGIGGIILLILWYFDLIR